MAILHTSITTATVVGIVKDQHTTHTISILTRPRLGVAQVPILSLIQTTRPSTRRQGISTLRLRHHSIRRNLDTIITRLRLRRRRTAHLTPRHHRDILSKDRIAMAMGTMPPRPWTIAGSILHRSLSDIGPRRRLLVTDAR